MPAASDLEKAVRHRERMINVQEAQEVGRSPHHGQPPGVAQIGPDTVRGAPFEVLSGAQAGADWSGMNAARNLGIPVRGWITEKFRVAPWHPAASHKLQIESAVEAGKKVGRGDWSLTNISVPATADIYGERIGLQEAWNLQEVTEADVRAFNNRRKKISGDVAESGKETLVPTSLMFTKASETKLRTTGYEVRTWKNVQNSDVTLWFGSRNSPGANATLEAALMENKTVLFNPTPDDFAEWAARNQPRSVNIAGNRSFGRGPTSGQVKKMDYNIDAKDLSRDLREVFSEGSSTIELAEKGYRTSTIRGSKLGETGELIYFDRSAGKGVGKPRELRPQQYRITGHRKLHEGDFYAVGKERIPKPELLHDLSRTEGWSEEKLATFKVSKKQLVRPGAYVTYYEKVKRTLPHGPTLWHGAPSHEALSGAALHMGRPIPFEVPNAEAIIEEVLLAGKNAMESAGYQRGVIPPDMMGWQVNPLRPWEMLDIGGPQGRQHWFDIGNRVEIKHTARSAKLGGSHLPLGHPAGALEEPYYIAQMADGTWGMGFGSPYKTPSPEKIASRNYRRLPGDLPEWGPDVDKLGPGLPKQEQIETMKRAGGLQQMREAKDVSDKWVLSQDGPKHLKKMEKDLIANSRGTLNKENRNLLNVAMREHNELTEKYLTRATEILETLSDVDSAAALERLEGALKGGSFDEYNRVVKEIFEDLSDPVPFMDLEDELNFENAVEDMSRLLPKANESKHYASAQEKVRDAEIEIEKLMKQGNAPTPEEIKQLQGLTVIEEQAINAHASKQVMSERTVQIFREVEDADVDQLAELRTNLMRDDRRVAGKGDLARLYKNGTSPAVRDYYEMRHDLYTRVLERIEELGGTPKLADNWELPFQRQTAGPGSGYRLLRTMKGISAKAKKNPGTYILDLNTPEKTVLSVYMGLEPGALDAASVGASVRAGKYNLAKRASGILRNQPLPEFVNSLPGTSYRHVVYASTSGDFTRMALKQIDELGRVGREPTLYRDAILEGIKDNLPWMDEGQLKKALEAVAYRTREGSAHDETLIKLITNQMEKIGPDGAAMNSFGRNNELAEIGYSTFTQGGKKQLFVQKASSPWKSEAMPMGQSTDALLAHGILQEAVEADAKSIVIGLDYTLDSRGSEGVIKELQALVGNAGEVRNYTSELHQATGIPLLDEAIKVRGTGPEGVRRFLTNIDGTSPEAHGLAVLAARSTGTKTDDIKAALRHSEAAIREQEELAQFSYRHAEPEPPPRGGLHASPKPETLAREEARKANMPGVFGGDPLIIREHPKPAERSLKKADLAEMRLMEGLDPLGFKIDPRRTTPADRGAVELRRTKPVLPSIEDRLSKGDVAGVWRGPDELFQGAVVEGGHGDRVHWFAKKDDIEKLERELAGDQNLDIIRGMMKQPLQAAKEALREGRPVLVPKRMIELFGKHSRSKEGLYSDLSVDFWRSFEELDKIHGTTLPTKTIPGVEEFARIRRSAAGEADLDELETALNADRLLAGGWLSGDDLLETANFKKTEAAQRAIDNIVAQLSPGTARAGEPSGNRGELFQQKLQQMWETARDQGRWPDQTRFIPELHREPSQLSRQQLLPFGGKLLDELGLDQGIVNEAASLMSIKGLGISDRQIQGTQDALQGLITDMQAVMKGQLTDKATGLVKDKALIAKMDKLLGFEGGLGSSELQKLSKRYEAEIEKAIAKAVAIRPLWTAEDVKTLINLGHEPSRESLKKARRLVRTKMGSDLAKLDPLRQKIFGLDTEIGRQEAIQDLIGRLQQGVVGDVGEIPAFDLERMRAAAKRGDEIVVPQYEIRRPQRQLSTGPQPRDVPTVIPGPTSITREAAGKIAMSEAANLRRAAAQQAFEDLTVPPMPGQGVTEVWPDETTYRRWIRQQRIGAHDRPFGEYAKEHLGMVGTQAPSPVRRATHKVSGERVSPRPVSTRKVRDLFSRDADGNWLRSASDRWETIKEAIVSKKAAKSLPEKERKGVEALIEFFEQTEGRQPTRAFEINDELRKKIAKIGLGAAGLLLMTGVVKQTVNDRRAA